MTGSGTPVAQLRIAVAEIVVAAGAAGVGVVPGAMGIVAVAAAMGIEERWVAGAMVIGAGLVTTGDMTPTRTHPETWAAQPQQPARIVGAALITAVQMTDTVLLAEAAAAVADMLTAAGKAVVAIRTVTGFSMTAPGRFLRYSPLSDCFPSRLPALASASPAGRPSARCLPSARNTRREQSTAGMFAQLLTNNVSLARPEAAPEMVTHRLLMALTTATTAAAVSHLARALRRGIFPPHSLLVPASLVFIASHACTLSQRVASTSATPPRHMLRPCTTSRIHLAHWSRAALIFICVLQRVAG